MTPGRPSPADQTVTALVGEGTTSEGGPMDGGAHVRIPFVHRLDAQGRRWVHRLAKVAAKVGPRLPSPPAASIEGFPQCCCRRNLHVRRAGWQDPTVIVVDVVRDDGGEVRVPEGIGCDPDAEQPGPVEQAHGHQPTIAMPGTQAGGGALVTVPPEPPDVTGVELEGNGIAVPLPHLADDRLEIRCGGQVQFDGHRQRQAPGVVTSNRIWPVTPLVTSRCR